MYNNLAAVNLPDTYVRASSVAIATTMEDSRILLAAVSVLVVVIVLSKLKSQLLAAKPKLNLPPGPWALPMIGSLHHMITSPNLHRALHGLAQKYGPVVMFRLGEVPMMVVSSPAAALEVLKTHDIAFADRFTNATLSALTFHGEDMAFAPYGERWRQMRKISIMELLSVARVQSFRRIREEGVSRFMANLAASATAGDAVHLNKMVSRFVNDTVVREAVGSGCKHQDEYLNAFEVCLRQTLGLAVADLFPSWRLMQMIDTKPRKVLAARSRIERILEQIIKETTEAMERGQHVEGILSVLLRLQKEGSPPIPLTNQVILMLMFDLFGAGSDTSSTLLTWCMTELVRSPPTMAKVQAEVREAFKGKESTAITEDDIKGLSYLKLVIKETLRMHCPVPLLLPRKCRETTKIMGYDIPKGTVVFANAWAIGRDPKYWEDAEEFKPERFDKSNLDYKGTNFEYLPFGSGRRSCPGINLGLCNIELALASLLYHFDWKLPKGMEPKDVDLGEAPGLVVSKKTNLTLHPVTRIAPAARF